MKVAILSDGKPGHFNQSIGIADIISEDVEVDYKVFDIEPKFKFLIKIYQRFFIKDFNKNKAKKIINLFKPIDIKNFDLLISSGANTSMLSAALSKIYKVKNIHCGSIKKINLDNYSAHITVEPRNDSPNNIVTKIAPSRFKPSVITKKDKQNRSLFLIGGDGAGYKYTLEDWNDLVKGIKALSQTKNIKPIIVTSRRTNIDHENFIYKQLAGYADNLSVWAGNDSSKLDLEKLFMSVDNIFVTEESATMMSEAISSGISVCSLAPKNIQPNKLFLDQLERYTEMNLLERMRFDSNLSITKSRDDNTLIVSDIRNTLKKQILERIK